MPTRLDAGDPASCAGPHRLAKAVVNGHQRLWSSDARDPGPLGTRVRGLEVRNRPVSTVAPLLFEGSLHLAASSFGDAFTSLRSAVHRSLAP